MKLVQFYRKSDADKTVRVGLWQENGDVVPLAGGLTMKQWIAQSAETGAPERAVFAAEDRLRADEIALGAPLHDPGKMIFVGLNYIDHAAESKMEVPKVPVLFAKYANSIVGPGDDVIIPEEVDECDYEVELAVIIGKTAKRVSREDAMDYVFGYTVINDVSARDLQLNEGQWTRGKAIDTFAPMGPCIVTKDEIADPHRLDLSLTLNGQTMQSANTRDLIFDIPYLISFLSRTMTLSPGDVISTGTPPGVGLGRIPPVWIKDGDVTEAYVEGIGTLRNRYVKEKV
jgi:2-keto-4-pentenoate hydratase/2-oxohepta-3-ene-1,7-dioic acid hydratase in catechol pathway